MTSGEFDDEDFDPEQAERQVQAFLDAAAALDGPPVAELAADVAGLVAQAWGAVASAWRSSAPTS